MAATRTGRRVRFADDPKGTATMHSQNAHRDDYELPHIDEPIHPDELGPAQLWWSPLGDGEHDFSYGRVRNPWTAELDKANARALEIMSAPDDEESEEVESREIRLITTPLPKQPTHRILITAKYYDSWLFADYPDLEEGVQGTFRTAYDLTPSTTWEDFFKHVRRVGLENGLPKKLKRGDSLVMQISAMIERETVILHRKVKEKVEIRREQWQWEVGRLVRKGVREVEVVCYLKGRVEVPRGQARLMEMKRGYPMVTRV